MAQILLLADPRPLVERLGRVFFLTAPKCPGVYLMRDAQDTILYVGKAKNLRQRLNSYRIANPDRLARRHLRLLRQVVRIELQECADELAALAKEAELLRALKPKFNRAGVWPGTPRFLVWRGTGVSIAMAIAETPTASWQAFGPFGSGLKHLRASVARLAWYALNPTAGAGTMPHGWIHGCLGEVATITAESETARCEMEEILTTLFAGDAERFTAWVGEQTKTTLRAYDLEVRAADLETVSGFIRKKARRMFTTIEAGRRTADKAVEAQLPFAHEDWNLT